jgi:hypothetical protein
VKRYCGRNRPTGVPCCGAPAIPTVALKSASATPGEIERAIITAFARGLTLDLLALTIPNLSRVGLLVNQSGQSEFYAPPSREVRRSICWP